MAGHLPMNNLWLEMNSVLFYLFSYHHLDFAKFNSDRTRITPAPPQMPELAPARFAPASLFKFGHIDHVCSFHQC